MPSRRGTRLASAIALVPFTLLVWRFDWVYDDAYISFRYAWNLANGNGLCFNPGVDPPVEGYTNFLWVLALALVEWLGAASTVWSRVLSIGCALALLAAVARRAAGSDAPPLGRIGAALFFATLPPLAVWATSGLETMAFTLALFLTYDQMARPDGSPRWVRAGCAAAATSLLRADGAVYAGIVLAAVVVTAARDVRGSVLRAGLRVGIPTALVVAAHVAWRYSYYGELLPNTAHTKVSFSASAVLQGRDYLLELLLTFPSIPLVLLGSLALVLCKRSGEETGLLLVVLGVLAVVVGVGGDFMAMGRFVVPALPFACVLLGRQLAALGGPAGRRSLPAGTWLAALVGLSLPAAWDVHVVPEAVRSRYRLARFSETNTTQYTLWQTQRQNTESRAALGRALRRYTQPGESLVQGAIGAVGYYSRMFLYDKYGLVNREVSRREQRSEEDRSGDRPPGHLKGVAPRFFLKYRPTYVEATLVGREKPAKDGPAVRDGAAHSVRYEFHELEPDLRYQKKRFLRLERLVFE